MRPTIDKRCLNCNRTFAAQVRYVKQGMAKFCSIKCAGEFRTKNKPEKPHNVKCAWCNKSFYKAPSRIKKSKTGLVFCCRKHKDLAQRLNGLDNLQPIHYGTSIRSKDTYRRIAFEHFKSECNRCGYDEYIQLLEVHHINENCSDNNISNLEILCVMCHRKHHYGLE